MECPSCLAWVPPPDTTCDCGEVVRPDAAGADGWGTAFRAVREAPDEEAAPPDEPAATQEPEAPGEPAPPREEPPEPAEPSAATVQGAEPPEPPQPEEPPLAVPELRTEPEEPGDRARRKRITPFRYHGEAGTLFKIQIINLCLRFLTLGVYTFWARTRLRRYVFGQLSYRGQRFAWHGSGREGFVGFLRLVGLVLFVGVWLAFAATAVAYGLGEESGNPFRLGKLTVYASVGFQLAFGLVLPPLAIVAGRRYRLSRLSLNGVHFSFRGTYKDFFRLVLPHGLLVAVTFGLAYPWFWARLNGWLWANTWYGNRRFACELQGRDLLVTFAVTALLALPTLGLSTFWLAARQRRLLAAGVTLGKTRFRSGITGFGLLKVSLLQLALTVLTLGLASAWAKTRTLRYMAEQTAVVGSLDLHEIRQEVLEAEATADALLDDAGFDGLAV